MKEQSEPAFGRISGVGRRIASLIDSLYLPPFQRIFSPEIFRYAVCGGITFSVNTVCYALIYHFVVAKRLVDLGFVVLSPQIATLVPVFPITFFTGFWLNRHVAFRTPPAHTSRLFFRYALSVGGSILLTYGIQKLLTHVCGFWATPSNVVTYAIVSLYSYLAARYFTFQEKTVSLPKPTVRK